MVAVDDAPEVRYHRARKAWPCAGRRGDDCRGEIAGGDLYAEVRHAGLSERSFGRRYCLACAGNLAPSPNGSAPKAAATSRTKPVNGVARPGVATTRPMAEEPPAVEAVEETGLRSVVEPADDIRESVAHAVRLVVLWVLAVALSLGLLYGALRTLDWLMQVMQQPLRPGGPV
jgi:hypothetical protein